MAQTRRPTQPTRPRRKPAAPAADAPLVSLARQVRGWADTLLEVAGSATAEAQRATMEKRERSVRIENAKQGLYALFGTGATPQERGKLLETTLNSLFQAYGVLVRKAFRLVGVNRPDFRGGPLG